MKLLVLCVCLALVPAAVPLFSFQDPHHALTLEKSGLGDIWKNCGGSSDIVQINSLTVSPDPPEKGKSVKISGNITTSATISGGTVEIKAKYGIIPVVDQKENICDLLKEVSLACPLKAGNYATTQNTTIPSEAPSGHYTGSVVGKDSDGKQLFCIDLDAHL